MALKKYTADYFPHYVNGSATKHALERRYGNDGYAFWFKLLEILCSTGTFSLDLKDLVKMEWLMDLTHMDEEHTLKMVDYLADLEAIDKELWTSQKIVWCSNLLDNLDPVFSRRVDKPKKPSPLNNPPIKLDRQTEGCIQTDNIKNTSCRQNVNIKSANGVKIIHS
jgi:hypothetical protein